MDCTNVQSVIDMDLRLESANEQIQAHLSCCRDCHRYELENRALHTLLGAQPGIAAPSDFDYKLRARLARGTSSQEHENTALLALLRTQPALDAPADFDFKLRARLARAKSEPAASYGISSKLKIPFAFSLGRTVAATTTLALVVAVSALHFAHSDRGYQSSMASMASMPNTANTVAKLTEEKVGPATANSGVPNSDMRDMRDMNVTAMADKPSFSAKSRYRNQAYIPASATVARARTLSAETEVEGSVKSVKNVVLEDMWRGFDPEKREIITTRNRDLIGAENSASTLSKTVSFVPSI